MRCSPQSEIVEAEELPDENGCVDANGVQIAVGDIVATVGNINPPQRVFVVEEISYLQYSCPYEAECWGNPGYAVSGGTVYERLAEDCVKVKSVAV
jgi:hypothetical protein